MQKMQLALFSQSLNKGRNNAFAVTVLLAAIMLFASCSPAVKLTASWNDNKVSPAKFSRILVLSVGKDLAKRKLGEDKIKAELLKDGFTAEASLDIFPPDFAKGGDSAKIRAALLDKGFDGVITIRVLSVNEHERWIPGSGYYYPAFAYHGFYRYYYNYGFYYNTGYMATDVNVLLESNLYNVRSGELLWSGQSEAFSRNPTPHMAEQYAKNILADLLQKKVIAQ